VLPAYATTGMCDARFDRLSVTVCDKLGVTVCDRLGVTVCDKLSERRFDKEFQASIAGSR
jgi:hypothetical protein